MTTSNPSIHSNVAKFHSKSKYMFISGDFMYRACGRQGSMFLVLRSKGTGGKCAKFHAVAASNNKDHLTWLLYYCLFAPHIFVCCSSRTSRLWWIALSTQHQLRGCNNIPRLQWMFFLWRLHLAPPSHPGQRATLLWLENPSSKCAKVHTVAASNNRDPTSCSFYFCLFVPHSVYMGVLLYACPVRDELHIQQHANQEITIATLAARLD